MNKTTTRQGKKLIEKALHEAQANCGTLDFANARGCNIPRSEYEKIWDRYRAIVAAVRS